MKIFNNYSKDAVEALYRLPAKQMTLFCCDCAFKVLPIFEKQFPDNKSPRRTIELAINYEEYAREKLIEYAVQAWHYSSIMSGMLSRPSPYVIDALNVVACAIQSSASLSPYVASSIVNHLGSIYADLSWLDQLYLNAVKKQDFTKTPDIQGLIREIKENRDFSLMPILFDALEDQGLEIDRTKPYGLSHWVLN